MTSAGPPITTRGERSNGSVKAGAGIRGSLGIRDGHNGTHVVKQLTKQPKQ